MKLSVVVVAFNMPEFIEIQYLLLKKYLLNDFDLFIYNNSDQNDISNNIQNECARINLQCINVPQNIFTGSDASHRAGKSLDYAINHNMVNYPGYTHMMILDSDMFLAGDFDIIESLGDSDIMGIYQQREHVFYYTNQLIFANLQNLPNFEVENKFLPGIIDGQGTDCGGYLYEYINKYNIKHSAVVNNIHSGKINSSNISEIEKVFVDYFEKEIEIMDGNSFSEYFSSVFLHFRAGSNWINFDNNIKNKRNSLLFEFLKNKIK